MLDLKEYVAIQDFSMSLDNGKTPIYVKKGETLEFDGLNVVFRGETGTARPLAKVIGEWISPIGNKVSPVRTAGNLARPTRNVTGGRIIEHSDYPSDPEAHVANPPSDSVSTLLKNYDKIPEIKVVNGKREVTSDLDDIRREVTIIDNDAIEARKVTAPDGAPVTNKGGVEIGKEATAKSMVMTREGQVTKETNYSGKEAIDNSPKKLVIDYEASGVVVKKTGVSAKQTQVVSEGSLETVETEVEVGETSYPAQQTTDVGSSTQAYLEQRKSTAKKPVPKKKPASKKGKPAPKKVAAKPVSTAPTVAKGVVVSSDGQEAVVVSKISRDERVSIKTEDGITSKVTVGAIGEMDTGEVEFSSGSDFEEPGVTISAGGDTPVDIIEGDDLDLNSILSDE
jgi:hypothetical protein